MTVSGFTGPYTLPDDIAQKTDHIVHLCAGSGSVPNFSILKGALREAPSLRQTFIYSNKTWDDIIFRDALNQLAADNPGRVRVVHTLTRQKDFSTLPAGVLSGRLTTDTAARDRARPLDRHFLRLRSRAVAVGSSGRKRERRRAITPVHGERPRDDAGPRRAQAAVQGGSVRLAMAGGVV